MASSFQSAFAKARKRQAAPSLPPLGSYDPSLLLTYGQNKRTADNAQQQYDLGSAQAQDNFGIQTQRLTQSTGNSLQDLQTSRDRNLQDLGTGHAQNLADLLTGRTRLTEDHATALANLGHSYANLAESQAQGANRGNVVSAGILAQSLAKRQANEARDQAPIDTSYNRGLADSTTAEQRANDQYGTSTSRVAQDYATGTGRIGQDAANQKADLLLSLTRAYGSGTHGQPLGTNTLNLIQTKNDALTGNLDLSGVAYQQAAANGYRFPTRKRKATIV